MARLTVVRVLNLGVKEAGGTNEPDFPDGQSETQAGKRPSVTWAVTTTVKIASTSDIQQQPTRLDTCREQQPSTIRRIGQRRAVRHQRLGSLHPQDELLSLGL
jgi:hypothetical protein